MTESKQEWKSQRCLGTLNEAVEATTSIEAVRPKLSFNNIVHCFLPQNFTNFNSGETLHEMRITSL